MAGKIVYISCASSDTPLLDMVSAALDAWEVVYTSLEQPKIALAEQMLLPEHTQAAIRHAEVFLRLCTAATASSASMSQELHFYRALEVEDRQKRRGDKRTLINLILDGGYQREPFDAVTLFITTAGKTRALWLDELARPLGVATQAQRLSRRSAVLLGLATGITVVSATAAGGLLLRNQRAAAAAHQAAIGGAFGAGDKLGGQPAWVQGVSKDFVSSTSEFNPTVSVAFDGTALYAFSPDIIQAFTPSGDPTGKPFTFSNIQTPSPLTVETPLPFAGSQVLGFQDSDAQGNNNLAVVDIRSRSLLWHASTAIGIYSPPAGPVTVVGSTLYCLFPLHADWSVCAFELRTGQVKWSYSIGLGTPHPGIAYSDGRLYIGDPYRCTCLDAETGKKIWQYHLHTTVVATVVISDGLALFGGLDGFFYALDAYSGKLQWRTNLAAPVSAQAAAAGNTVYVGDADGYLWALDLASGKIYWRVFAGENESQDAGTPDAIILYPPVVYRNLVAVVANDTLCAVDLVSGIRRWAYQTQASNVSNRGMATGPLFAGGYFVVGDSQNHLIAFNP